MKLYSLPHSPYAARVRLQIYLRNLPVQVAEPLGGMGSPEYKALSATGKVPLLDIDGEHLPESVAIMEFLEDYFQESGDSIGKSLLGDTAEYRGWQRAVIRIADLYLAQALFPLFKLLGQSERDAEQVASGLDGLREQLTMLQQCLDDSGKNLNGELDLIDAALVPMMFYVLRVPPVLGEANILSDTPALDSWWQHLQNNTHVVRVIAEMDEGLARMLGA